MDHICSTSHFFARLKRCGPAPILQNVGIFGIGIFPSRPSQAISSKVGGRASDLLRLPEEIFSPQIHPLEFWRNAPRSMNFGSVQSLFWLMRVDYTAQSINQPVEWNERGILNTAQGMLWASGKHHWFWNQLRSSPHCCAIVVWCDTISQSLWVKDAIQTHQPLVRNHPFPKQHGLRVSNLFNTAAVEATRSTKLTRQILDPFPRRMSWAWFVRRGWMDGHRLTHPKPLSCARGLGQHRHPKSHAATAAGILAPLPTAVCLCRLLEVTWKLAAWPLGPPKRYVCCFIDFSFPMFPSIWRSNSAHMP